MALRNCFCITNVHILQYLIHTLNLFCKFFPGRSECVAVTAPTRIKLDDPYIFTIVDFAPNRTVIKDFHRIIFGIKTCLASIETGNNAQECANES